MIINRYKMNMIILVITIVILMNLLFLQGNYTIQPEEQEYIEENYSNSENTDNSYLNLKISTFINYSAMYITNNTNSQLQVTREC